jgi:hypothetical protein
MDADKLPFFGNRNNTVRIARRPRHGEELSQRPQADCGAVRRYKAWGRLEVLLAVLGLLLCAAMGTARAANLSDPQVDAYNVRVGTETFAALYKFTANSALVETAQAITNMGSDTIKFYLGSDASGQAGVNLPANVTNLLTLVRDDPDYHQVLDMPFRHFVMWAYPLENSDEWWGGGYNTTQGAKDYQEMYNLTHYLLTNYNNSGKTFYLGHWEGDGYLKVNDWATNPSMTTVQGMIGWLNNRQQAVDDAKNATTYTNVMVYNYAECNRVRDAMLNDSNNNVRVINYVVPYVTNLDCLSYSSYDSQNLSSSDLYTTLNYMESMIPTNKAATVPGPRMWIGEYGWGYESVAAQEPVDRSYIQRLLGWNWNGQCLPFLLFWEMYSNYNPNGATNFCLVDYTDNKVPSWYLQHYFFNAARLLTAQFKEQNGRLPTDTEFSSLTTPLLNQPLTAPVEFALTNAGATLVSNTAVAVSGTLAQGIYGDPQATLWVFYGPQDGGTVVSAWAGSHYVGVNTNFSPATFTVTLSNLLPQTNYFYRFYASDFATGAWAQASSQFSTVTANPPDYGSRMKVFFSGYNRSETLSNFPALVTFSTNLPGFSYQQLASPTGGDLRFTDAGGYRLIPHEIDEWNTNGTSTVWVDVPSIASTNDFVWAYWGNPAATALPAYCTNGSAWPTYDVVWHLKESGFPFADSTQQHPAAAGVAPVSAPGEIGHGVAFNGSSEYLNPGPVGVGTSFTLSAWIKLALNENNIQAIWANKPGGWNSAGFALYVNTYNTTDGKLFLETGDGSTGYDATSPGGLLTAGQWHFVAASVNETGGTAQLYVDGVNCTASSTVDAAFPNQTGLNLGRLTNNTYYFNGVLDEARIQAGAQSSNWVWASWATVASNSVFQSYSAITQQMPALTIGVGGGTASLNWAGSSVGFALYTATNLGSSTWTPATNQPVLTNSQWQIALPVDSSATRFYRLKSQ